ncbi:MAG TPA: FAD binding domain-containing protein [Alphaproteobacteria bacterium]
MKAAAFDYARPTDVPGAVKLLASDGAKLLAGGQSLGPLLNLRLARPRLLIDVSRLSALQAIEDTGNAWRIGAAVTHAALEDRAGRLPGAEMLVEVASGIAYRSVRTRGTVGGSLAHADPAADWPLALAALGATVVVRSARGSRNLPAETFMQAAFTTALAADELVEAVVVPKLSAAACWGYFKFCRKTGEFPESSAATVFDPERRTARIFVGALSGPPQPLPGLARAVAERGPAAATREAIAQAVTAAAPNADTVERRLHAATVGRALRQVFAA